MTARKDRGMVREIELLTAQNRRYYAALELIGGLEPIKKPGPHGWKKATIAFHWIARTALDKGGAL